MKVAEFVLNVNLIFKFTINLILITTIGHQSQIFHYSYMIKNSFHHHLIKPLNLFF